MTTEEMAVPVPLTTVARVEPLPPGGPVARRDDHGAFRAVEPGSGRAVVIRPTADGLVLEREPGREIVPWDAVTGVDLLEAPAGRTHVAAARILLREGPTLEMARMYTAGAEYLPFSLTEGGPPLLRVERLRLLVAAIVAGSGCVATAKGEFRHGERFVPRLQVTPRPRMLPAWTQPMLLLLSVVALVLVFPVSIPGALAIMVVLFVHEYGHVVAMRLCGVRERGVLFLPLLGAATVPEHSFDSRWDEARVALAGPITALPLAVGVLFAWRLGWLSDDLGQDAFRWTLLLNLLNLLPLMPLDGGRALMSVAAGLPFVARKVVAYAPATLAALLLVFGSGDAMTFGAAVFVVFAIVVTRITFRRHALHRWMEDAGLDLAGVRNALRDVSYALTGAVRDDVDGGVPPVPMTGAQVVGVIGMYLAVALTLFGLLVAASMIAPILAGGGG